MTKYERERARADSIVRAVLDDLSGRADFHSVILDKDPDDKLCIGVLTPPPPDGDSPGGPRYTKRKPDSLGFDARVRPSANGTVSGVIDVSFLIYHRIVPTLEEQRASDTGAGKQAIRPAYRRSKIEITDLPFSISMPAPGGIEVADMDSTNDRIFAECRMHAEEMKGDPDYWPTAANDVKIDHADLSDEAGYRSALPNSSSEIAKWIGRLEVTAASTSDGYRISVLFSNTTQPSVHPTPFFDVQLKARLASGEFVSKPFAAAALDYRYETVTYGHGINAVLKVDDPTQAEAVTTPLHQQQRIASREVGEAASATVLAGGDTFSALGLIEENLRAYADRWREFIAENAANADIQAESPKDLALFEQEVETFALGVTALREDERLLKAFKFMNETASEHIATWRLFQIVFIVSMLPSLIAREHPSDHRWSDQLDIADVLWFPTGGGKTEAAFGVIVAGMFYDRLRGKKRGTTAWLRYPLRMLSIQQLQRLVEFVYTADTVRKKHAVNSGEPFTVGYYVGSANTPNYLTKKSAPHPIVTFKAKIKDGAPDAGGLRVLQKCPNSKCGSPNVEVEIRDEMKDLRILHWCRDCGERSPISISDAEIYRYLPTVLVGTVDRLARAGEAHHFAHIFGQVDSHCPEHGFASFHECVELGCKRTKSKFEAVEAIKDPTPALLLQDELHLLKESLGTYDAHYEGYLDEQARSIGTHLPSKRLAATATIEGYSQHVKHLYGRRARRFPSKGILLDDTPYISKDTKDPFARLYVGILPFGPTTDQVCVRIAERVHALAEAAWAADPTSTENGFYDLSLLYGNLKDGVTNMGSVLHDLQGMNFARNLSGEHSLNQVREVIDIVEGDVKRPYTERLKCVIATSIISHGVDLERFNVMAISGFPGRAADYIQASSRSGRKHIGIVFTVYNPTYNIDRSAYVHFTEYHDRLYQLVQPVPVNRFSEAAIARTFNGLYAATLLNVVSRESDRNLISGDKAVMAFATGTITDADMLDRIVRAYGINDPIFDLDDKLREKYVALIEKRTVQARQDIEMGEEWATHRRLKPTPVSSLRNVQEQIGFRIDQRRIRTVEMIERNRK